MRFGFLALLAMLGVTVHATPAGAAPIGSSDIKIGFIGRLTGAGGTANRDLIDGFRLGLKDLGGRFGAAEVELLVVDDRRDPATARRALSRMIQDDHVRVVLVGSDERTVADLVRVASAARTVILNLGLVPATLAGKDCNPYFFSLVGLPSTPSEIAGQALRAQGYTRPLLVGPDATDALRDVEAFARGYHAYAPVILSRRGEMDFVNDINRIQAETPDSLFLLFRGGMAVNFLTQYASAVGQGGIPLYASANAFNQDVLAGGGTASLGLLTVGSWSEDLDSPTNRRYVAEFESEFGRQPSAQGAVGYDAAMLLDAAWRTADKKANDPSVLRQALLRAEFTSTRPGFRFDANHFPVLTYVLDQVVKDARGRPMGEQRTVLVRDVREGRGNCPMRLPAEPPPPPKK